MAGIIIVIIMVIVFILKSVQQKGSNGQGNTGQNEWHGSSRTTGSYRYSGSTGSASRSGSVGSTSRAGSAGSTSRSGPAGSTSRSGSIGSTSRSSSAGNTSRSGSTGSTSRSGSTGRSQLGSPQKSFSSASSEEKPQDIRIAAGIDEDDGAILSAAKINSYVTEMDNELDSKEDLMKPVYDMMITGPDTSIPSGRDFIAEATDMLNSFTTKGD